MFFGLSAFSSAFATTLAVDAPGQDQQLARSVQSSDYFCALEIQKNSSRQESSPAGLSYTVFKAKVLRCFKGELADETLIDLAHFSAQNSSSRTLRIAGAPQLKEGQMFAASLIQNGEHFTLDSWRIHSVEKTKDGELKVLEGAAESSHQGHRHSRSLQKPNKKSFDEFGSYIRELDQRGSE